MNQDNGGIIGKINTPTTSVASGVWTLDSQFEAQSSSIWPLAFPQTTFTNSVRLDTDTTFTRTLGASPTNAKKGTISFWFKKVATPNSSKYGRFVHIGSTGNDLSLYTIDDYFQWYIDGATNGTSSTSGARLYRDQSAWYHIIYAFDSTQATAADRIKIYINGELQDSTAQPTTTSVTLNTDIFDASHDFCIGATNSTSLTQNLDGYLAEFIYIDGTQLDATSFGATNPVSNIWEPISYAGTYGTNGFKLNFSDSSALGDDTSGNGNDFTVNNLTSIDQSTDTPSNNFATLNPLSTVHTENISSMLSEGNTKYDPTGDYSIVKSTIPFPESGKWYVEIKLGTSGTIDGQFGVMRIPATSNGTNSYIGYNTNDAGYAYYNGKVKRSTGGSGDTRTDVATGLATYSSGDTLALLFNADDNEIKWYVQDSLEYTLDLSSAPHGFYANDGEWVFAMSAYGTYTTFNVNFGNPSVSISSGNTDGNGYGNFEYSTKSGYALCTKNLAEFG